MSADQRLKKLRGSGGFVMATIGDDLQQKGNLGGPDLFLAPIGRLPEALVSSYHCNACEKAYEGCPRIDHEEPNEPVSENLVLVERGQYVCTACESPIAEYRVFHKPNEGADAGLARPMGAPPQAPPESVPPGAPPPQGSAPPQAADVSSIAGMAVYDERAVMVGTARQVGVDSASGSLVLTVEAPDGSSSNVPWSRVGTVGEIVVLGAAGGTAPAPAPAQAPGACASCGFANKAASKFCEQCGKAL
ncbi:MAG: hypothetical protein OXD41_06295 [Thaumarchaeota archaeon]|nr:hypothetical protein [Nitrososphaerota archaeon]MDD9843159.1 hypothetical protein [Nitrososphaerota archaeon]